MEPISIIASIIVIVAVAIIIVISAYRMAKKNSDADHSITLDTFIATYGDTIILVLKNVVTNLQKNIKDYVNKETYQIDIITNSINTIKDSCGTLGIPENILNLFDSEALANVISSILQDNKMEVFSALPSDSIKENEKLYDNDVIATLVEAEETPSTEVTTTTEEPAETTTETTVENNEDNK